MNNIQFWIWLIVIVVTLISRLRKKKQPEIPRSSQAPQQPELMEEESTKPMTFEELLREIQAAKKPAPAPLPSPYNKRVDYDDDIEEEAKSLEKVDYSSEEQQRANEVYEKAKKEAFYRPSLEETLKLEDTIVRFGQFKGYQHNERLSPAREFAKEVRTPSGFKKAFIMSEILKRRF